MVARSLRLSIGVLAAYFNEAIGLITCKRALLGQTAKKRPPCGVAKGFGLVERFNRDGVLSGVGAGKGVDNDVENGVEK